MSKTTVQVEQYAAPLSGPSKPKVALKKGLKKARKGVPKKRATPGTGALNYGPNKAAWDKAEAEGDVLLADPTKHRKKRFRPGRFTLDEIHYFQTHTSSSEGYHFSVW